MRDAFYTILIIWIVWRILNSINAYRAAKSQRRNNVGKNNRTTTGETTINYSPLNTTKIPDDEGEYVDYEEVKE